MKVRIYKTKANAIRWARYWKRKQKAILAWHVHQHPTDFGWAIYVKVKLNSGKVKTYPLGK